MSSITRSKVLKNFTNTKILEQCLNQLGSFNKQGDSYILPNGIKLVSAGDHYVATYTENYRNNGVINKYLLDMESLYDKLFQEHLEELRRKAEEQREKQLAIKRQELALSQEEEEKRKREQLAIERELKRLRKQEKKEREMMKEISQKKSASIEEIAKNKGYIVERKVVDNKIKLVLRRKY